jgi:hypothetical protein
VSSDAVEVEDLLRRGGWDRAEGRPPAAYDPFRDPPGARRLAELLATEVREMSPDILVVWQEVADAAIGLEVAQILAIPIVRAMDADGLVVHQGDLPRDATAVLAGVSFDDPRAVHGVTALLEKHGGRLIGVAAAVQPHEELPVAVRSLVVPSDPALG